MGIVEVATLIKLRRMILTIMNVMMTIVDDDVDGDDDDNNDGL